MRTLVCGMVAAVAVAGLATAAEAKCIKASGEGTAITHEVATELAKVALNTSISGWGGKARGKSSTSCKYDFIFSTCKVHSRACK